MNEPLASLQIDPQLIEQITKKTLEAMITANLGNPEVLIEKIVEKALKTKVNSCGNIGTSSYENSHDLIEVIAAKTIQDMAKKIVVEFVEQKAGLIKEAVKKELEKPDRSRQIAKAILDATEESIKSTWNFQCNINFASRNE